MEETSTGVPSPTPNNPLGNCTTLNQPYPGVPSLGLYLSLLQSQPPWAHGHLPSGVQWTGSPFSGQPAAHSVAPCFCQFLRAGGYMLTLPESRPPGEAQRTTEEHWTPRSERPGAESLGCGNLPWTHTLRWGKGFACLHSSIPTQHLEHLELAGTWTISLSMLSFSRPSSMKSRWRFFIYEIVVLSPRCGAGKAGSVFTA